MPARLNVLAQGFVLRLANALVRLVSTARPVRFARKDFSGPHAKHAPRAVLLAMTE